MNKTGRKCAYCDGEDQLTKEHVVPNFLYKANPLAKFGYNIRADRFMTWEAQVKDVCAECNNHYLSDVDSYAKDFCKENRIERMITEEKAVKIKYDHAWLSRVLLKITFNCMRLKGNDVIWISHFKEYILHGTNFPPHNLIRIGVAVFPCHRITKIDRKKLNGESKNWKYLPPYMIRVGSGYGSFSDDVFVRYVFVNNFHFFCIACRGVSVPQKLRTAMNNLNSVYPSVFYLNPHKSSANLRVSAVDCLSIFSDTALMLSDKWAEFQGNVY